MIPLSIDEQRIVRALEKWARSHDEGAARNPFSFHRIRAAVLRKAARAIGEGKHR